MKAVPGFFPNPLDLLFPTLCLLCTTPLQGEEAVCTPCLDMLLPTGLGSWKEGTTVHEGLDQVWSAFWFDETMQSLIHLLKYQGHRKVGWRLSEEVFRLLEGEFPWEQFDLLMPVPLHRVKQRERGYNQSVVLASRLGQLTDLPVKKRAVVRHRWTRSQTGLSVEARRENVAGSFRVARPGDGERVLLVDDVLTTGATASACALALKSVRYGAVAVITVATPRKEG